jgi:hypothetical protein
MRIYHISSEEVSFCAIQILYPNPDLLRYPVPQHSMYNVYHGFATIDRSTSSSDLNVSLCFHYTYLIKRVAIATGYSQALWLA